MPLNVFPSVTAVHHFIHYYLFIYLFIYLLSKLDMLLTYIPIIINTRILIRLFFLNGDTSVIIFCIHTVWALLGLLKLTHFVNLNSFLSSICVKIYPDLHLQFWCSFPWLISHGSWPFLLIIERRVMRDGDEKMRQEKIKEAERELETGAGRPCFMQNTDE